MGIEDFIKTTFDKTEYDKAIVFIKKHTKECYRKYADVTGSLLSYKFIPTGLGPLMEIECSCGCKETITGIDF